ncbi:glycosyltransferase [Motilimonas cestriensis]|uniref:Glycosyltransferase n=1 Tax=Motilimonas cestriensis TaxID=2742685 RepID=A0ABS8W5G2_9GAMM|nr:glycosyltransferase [Motilimonas cestriensis]MCE2594211.1 glycosyltransferase [Motilimonas cestriensis]
MTASVTLAFCTYNRAWRLPKLLASIRAQTCSVPFDILAINNNSQDNTLEVLSELQNLPGAELKVVTETQQGISFARNRAIKECLDQEVMIFMDDDELPLAGYIEQAWQSLRSGDYHIVGGIVTLQLDCPRPKWLTDNYLPFLAALDYGNQPFEITSSAHSMWTGNIAYRMEIFRRYPDLRFDDRYNRIGSDIGGGEDMQLFKQCLALPDVKIFYEPRMQVQHHIEAWRVRRPYFLKLHYRCGYKQAKFNPIDYQGRTLLGIPGFLFIQVLKQSWHSLILQLKGQPEALRQWMNACHTLGMLKGYRAKNSS